MAIEPDSEHDNLPRASVNFCDAVTYCAWAGKRLCGKIGGGGNLKGDYADRTKSQWYRACVGETVRKYPYGDFYDSAKCATESLPLLPAPKSFPNCHGVEKGYDLVFDLSGSVDEWEDSCATTAPGPTTSCRARGGSIGERTVASCDLARETAAKDRYAGVGFRCCKDL